MKTDGSVSTKSPGLHLLTDFPRTERRRADSLLLPTQEALDRFTALARELLEVPVAAISLTDADAGFRTSSSGLSAPIALLLSFPLCRRMVSRRTSLAVEDTRSHPLLAGSPHGEDGTVRAFVGTPLLTSDGRTAGTVFAMDVHPRAWTSTQIELIEKLAALIVGELELGAAMGRVSRSSPVPAH